MANSKKRRKIIVFSAIGVVLAGLAAFAIFRKREAVITIQTEKVARRHLTEIVSANGKIQPVVQVKISPEVSGEIIELPVKEGQCVQKGDLVVKIKRDFYLAQRNQSEASYKSSLAGKETAEANLRKAEAEFRRNTDLFRNKFISTSVFDEVQAAYDVAKAQLNSAEHQVEMSRALLASADDSLAKTTIVSPLTGTVSKLNCEVGERVLGTVQNIGTEIMTIADLNEMEARVDIGETDVILIAPGQNVRLEVDAFKDRKFVGTVTEIANSSNSSRGSTLASASTSQEATKFEVKIRIKEKEAFRPGMSVTAEIETRSRSNVLTVPIASVTTRLPKEKKGDAKKKEEAKVAALTDPSPTNSAGSQTDANGSGTNSVAGSTNAPGGEGTNTAKADKKVPKPIEVVFVLDGERVKMVPVKIGISDDSYWEITEGLQEGQEIVSGGYRAISRDLEDGKRIKKGPPPGEKDKEKEKEEEQGKT
jgi:HlyD family secretion protein